MVANNYEGKIFKTRLLGKSSFDSLVMNSIREGWSLEERQPLCDIFLAIKYYCVDKVHSACFEHVFNGLLVSSCFKKY